MWDYIVPISGSTYMMFIETHPYHERIGHKVVRRERIWTFLNGSKTWFCNLWMFIYVRSMNSGA